MAYKGWSDDEWNVFFSRWGEATDLAAKDAVLLAEGIRIFTWGGDTWNNALANARSESTTDMIDELAEQMADLRDITLIGWSKGGNLVLHYLDQVGGGELDGGIMPLRVVLLAAATHPAGILVGAPLAREEVPETIPFATSICSTRDLVCTENIRNAHDINPTGSSHGPHGSYAADVIANLNVQWHHGSHGPSTHDLTDGWMGWAFQPWW